jgi:hypothetical protein
MGKWADFLISEVRYGKNHLIDEVKIHTDDEAIGDSITMPRSDITHNIKNGKTYKTIFHSLKGWKLGEDVRLFRVNGEYFLRVDQNKVNQDNLGLILQY